MKQEFKEYLEKNKKEVYQLGAFALLTIVATIFMVTVLDGNASVPEEVATAISRADRGVGKVIRIVDDSTGTLNDVLTSSLNSDIASVKKFSIEQGQMMDELESHLRDITEELIIIGTQIDKITPGRAKTLLTAAVLKRKELTETMLGYRHEVDTLLETAAGEALGDKDALDQLMVGVNTETRKASSLDEEYQAIMEQFDALVGDY